MKTMYREEAWNEMATSLDLEYVSTPRGYDLPAIFGRTYRNVGAGNWRRTVNDDTYWLTVRSFAYRRLTGAMLTQDENTWEIAYHDDNEGRKTVLQGRITLRGKETPESHIDKRINSLGWVRGPELAYPAWERTRYAVLYQEDTTAAVTAEQEIMPKIARSTHDLRDLTVKLLRDVDDVRRRQGV
jgi:hypothetical protein